MSAIDRIRAQLAVASERPWQTGTPGAPVPDGAVQLGYFDNVQDGALALETCNAAAKLIALYDAIKAAQPRIAAGKALLAAQKKTVLAAVAALELT